MTARSRTAAARRLAAGAGAGALLCAATLVFAPVAPAVPADAGAGTQAGRDAARRVLGAMGGEEALARLRTLRFDFVVMRDGREVARFRHVWDRHDGRYRVEGTDRQGEAFLVLFDVDDRTIGRAWRAGRELTGEERTRAVERGYGRFINDTYWLLMPAKMLDPGVRLVHEGTEARPEGGQYEVVRLTFGDGVGLTPGDTYWAYVSDAGRMERWDFVLEGRTQEDRATFLWEDWRKISGVLLSLTKRSSDGGMVIAFENVSGSPEADDAAFEPPRAPSP